MCSSKVILYRACVYIVVARVLPYLEKWARSITATATERNNLLLSAETRLGLKITCTSATALHHSILWKFLYYTQVHAVALKIDIRCVF